MILVRIRNRMESVICVNKMESAVSFRPNLRKMPLTKDTVNVTISIGSSTATIAYLGASVHSWNETGIERLFTSSLSSLSGPKAIRGGIPLCFPCFGPPPKGVDKFAKLAQHGFARISTWTLDESSSGDTQDGQGVKAVFRTCYAECFRGDC